MQTNADMTNDMCKTFAANTGCWDRVHLRSDYGVHPRSQRLARTKLLQLDSTPMLQEALAGCLRWGVCMGLRWCGFVIRAGWVLWGCGLILWGCGFVLWGGGCL